MVKKRKIRISSEQPSSEPICPQAVYPTYANAAFFRKAARVLLAYHEADGSLPQYRLEAIEVANRMGAFLCSKSAIHPKYLYMYKSAFQTHKGIQDLHLADVAEGLAKLVRTLDSIHTLKGRTNAGLAGILLMHIYQAYLRSESSKPHGCENASYGVERAAYNAQSGKYSSA